jgi:5'-deoxynucleotidase YfbR-like HD superfamily hydrolase
MSWMITATGAEYHLHGPGAMTDAGRPVRIEDIAHQLAIINRFHGATSRPYSVAEHSLLCSEIAQRAGAPLIVQMAALMHDAHEAYTNDLSRPAKTTVNFRSVAAGGTRAWDVFENEHAKVVRAHFGLLTVFASHRAALREIDLVALATERRDLTAWCTATHAGWDVLRDNDDDPANRICPVPWMSLDTPERAAMTCADWRQQFIDRFDEISFGLA